MQNDPLSHGLWEATAPPAPPTAPLVGQIRADVNLHAVRAAIIGMAEGLWRDQVVANRSDLRADYGFDDVRQVMELLIGAFQEPPFQHAKAS